MEKLRFLSKSLDYSGGEATRTRVVLGNDEGAIYPVFFEPAAIEKDGGELEVMALEVIYQINYPNRAEKEKFAEQERLIAEIKAATSEAKEATVANRDAVNQAIVEMTALVASIYAKLAEAGIIVEEESND